MLWLSGHRMQLKVMMPTWMMNERSKQQNIAVFPARGCSGPYGEHITKWKGVTQCKLSLCSNVSRQGPILIRQFREVICTAVFPSIWERLKSVCGWVAICFLPPSLKILTNTKRTRPGPFSINTQSVWRSNKYIPPFAGEVHFVRASVRRIYELCSIILWNWDGPEVAPSWSVQKRRQETKPIIFLA